MRKIALLSALLLIAGSATFNSAQTAPTAAERKISFRVPPVYPELAKKMNIHGVVRVEAVVRPNGTVKSTRVLGGNPVLVSAAQDAIGKWKFEPAQSETTEVVQLAFDSQ